MAITKILSKRMRLDKLIRYVQNPDKTDDAVFTYCQYCDPKDAAKQMQATKERYGKTDGIQAFHIIQSFSPGEITPELAHELGIRFIKEHLSDYPKVNYKELKRFEQYKAQAAFLDRNKIDTREQLQAKIAELNGTVETLTKSRIIWNSKKKRRRELYSALSTVENLADVPDLYTQGVVGIEEDYKRYLDAERKLDGKDLEALKAERSEVYEKVASINAEIRECQKDFRLCKKIQADSPRIEQQMREQIDLDEREHDYSL